METKEDIKICCRCVLLWEGFCIWIILICSLFGKVLLRGTEIGEQMKDAIELCIVMMKAPAVVIAFMLLFAILCVPFIFWGWLECKWYEDELRKENKKSNGVKFYEKKKNRN